MVLIRSNTGISLFIFKKITSLCTKYEERNLLEYSLNKGIALRLIYTVLVHERYS